jgi:hypothetical protein
MIMAPFHSVTGLPYGRKALMMHKRRLVTFYYVQLPLLRSALGVGVKVDLEPTRAQLRQIR